MAHTPGPWKVTGKGTDICRHVESADGTFSTGCIMFGEGDAEANARLIAAAPDLLAALEAVEWVWHEDKVRFTCPSCHIIRDERRQHFPGCDLAATLAKAKVK